MDIEVNVIKEIYKGHYQVILDFPTPDDLIKIIDFSYKYIWGIEHREVPNEWNNYEYLLLGCQTKSENIKARNIEMEYLVETEFFKEMIPHIHQTINIVQTNIMPPIYLDINRLSGKGRYDLLKSKVDYLFELSIPGAYDFAPLISPNISFLENVIERFTK